MSLLTLPSAFDRFDARVERLVAPGRGGRADILAHALSAAADRSRLWAGLAVVRAVTGGPAGRGSAGRMIAVVGVESALIHGGAKRMFRRERPAVAVDLRFGARRPPSSAFPSGHAASAATAAVLLADGLPRPARAALMVLAAGVGWSRLQAGLHHASDVVAGAALGYAVGRVTLGLTPPG